MKKQEIDYTGFKTIPLSVFKPIYYGFLIYYLIGISLFFIALLKPEVLNWLSPVIEKLKSIFGMLHTAELVNSNPFPAQVVTLYTILTWAPVIAYNMYCVFIVDDINFRLSRRFDVVFQSSGSACSKKMYIKMLLVVVIVLVSYPFMALVHQYKPSPRTSYLEYSFYSSVSIKMLYIYFPISFSVACIVYLQKLMPYIHNKKK